MNVWDGQHKKRIRQFPQRMPVGREVSSLAFNSDGSCLAIGSIGSLLNAYSSDSINQSNCSTSGSIWIRKLGRSDVEPKRVS